MTRLEQYLFKSKHILTLCTDLQFFVEFVEDELVWNGKRWELSVSKVRRLGGLSPIGVLNPLHYKWRSVLYAKVHIGPPSRMEYYLEFHVYAHDMFVL